MGVPTITSTALIRHTSTATVKKETIPIIWYLFFFLLFYLIFFHTLFRVGDISSSSRSGQNVIGMKWSGKFNQNSFSLSGSKMKEKHCIWVKGMGGGGGGKKGLNITSQAFGLPDKQRLFICAAPPLLRSSSKLFLCLFEFQTQCVVQH